MKSRFLLLPAIVVATAGLGVSANAFSGQPDAQAQAAALLNPSYTSIQKESSVSSSNALDAQAHAAALLSGQLTVQGVKNSAQIDSSSAVRPSLDAHAHAAALLSGSRIRGLESAQTESVQTGASRERSNEHPAVVVAQSWNTRGLDPNTFIVGHPAGLQPVAASLSSQPAVAEVTASTDLTAAAGQ